MAWAGPFALLVSIGLVRESDAQNQGFQSRDVHQMRSVGEVRSSPDGRRIVYTVQHRDRPGRPYSLAWIRDVPSGKSARLGDGGVSHPRWSPDGEWIAYLGSEGDERRLMIIRPDGGQATPLAAVQWTNHPLPSTGERLTWSPDGKAIAFVSATPGPETEDAGGDPVVITRYLYKPTASEGLTRFNDNRRVHVFVVDLVTKKVRQLTHGDYYEHSIDWSPNGEEILFISNRESNPDQFFNYDIFAVKVSDGRTRRLTRTESAEYRPRWSPDGKTIAFQGTRRGLTSSETTMEDTHIWLMDADGSTRREIGAGIDNRQGAPGWSADGTTVYFTVQERGNIRLYRLPAFGGDPEVIVGEPGAVRSWSLSTDGAVAYGFTSPGDMRQLYLKTNDASDQLTHLNRELLAGRRAAEIESIQFLSFDGLAVEAYVTLPLGRTPGSKHPLIAMIKGGPHSQRGPSFNFKAQVYASRGWGVIMVNYRGSTGYGQAFADAIFGDQNGGEAKDVVYGVLAALRRYDWVDPERLGIEGGSYGGQLSNWIITQTPRFKAAIPIASISNLISFNYMAYYHDYLAVEFGALPHQDNLMDVLWERSALKHVGNVKTPTMLVHGENDNDVPIAEAEQYYIALKDVGVETIMVRYPREGHGIRETGHVVDLIDRSIAWYEKHFPPRVASAGPTAAK
jgi:dipeptidyl aminopeptidase/acylaminoacyl peptidase